MFPFSHNDNRVENLQDGPDGYRDDDNVDEEVPPRARDAETQRLRQKAKHPLRLPCCVACQCPDKFSEAVIHLIHEEFWSNHYPTQMN